MTQDLGLQPPITSGIGSEFWLSEVPIDTAVPENLVTTGRSALTLAISLLGLTRESIVYLPAFACGSVFAPFIGKVQVKTYDLNPSLGPQLEDIDQDADCILLIDYFGFIQDYEMVCKFFPKAKIIQDATHLIPNLDYETQADLLVASYRKSLGVPDGALINGPELKEKLSTHSLARKPHHVLFSETRLKALQARAQYISTGNEEQKAIAFDLFSKAEADLELYCDDPANAAGASWAILEATDIAKLHERRKENYQHLLDNLPIQAVEFSTKRQSYFGYPIVIKNRNELRERLIENRIYPPIHWILPKSVDPVKHPVADRLSQEIITIPCDQRYGLQHMDFIISVFKKITMEKGFSFER